MTTKLVPENPEKQNKTQNHKSDRAGASRLDWRRERGRSRESALSRSDWVCSTFAKKMQKIGATASGSILVEMSKEEFDALSKIAIRERANPEPSSDKSSLMSFDEKTEFVRPRLIKLGPKKSDSLVRSVKTMFNFTGGISDKEANQIIEKLKEDGTIQITAQNGVKYGSE